MNRRALHGLHMRRFPWMMLKAAIQAHSDLLENGWLGSRPSGMLCIKNPPETSGGTWSGRRDSDSRPPPWQGGALPTELLPQKWCLGAESNHRHCDFQSHALPTELPRQVAMRKGLEPSTSSVTGWHSNQLNYRTIHGGNNRARTCDPLLVRQMLSQLSYAPRWPLIAAT